MDAADFAALRPVSASMGIMLESVSARLQREGWRPLRLARQGAGAPPRDAPSRRRGARSVHHRHPDRHRRDASRAHRVAARDPRAARACTATSRRSSSRTSAPSPRRGWPIIPSRRSTICCGRSRWRGWCCGPRMSVQAPPNLSPGALEQIVAAGINDWGGVSPITPDFVNPEAPWPHLERLAEETARAGKLLQERLTIYPSYALDGETWLDDAIRPRVLEMMDADGLARVEELVAGRGDRSAGGRPRAGGGGSALRSDVGQLPAPDGADKLRPYAERRCAARHPRPRATRRRSRRRRGRHALPRPRRRLRSGGARRRRAAARDARRRRHLRRQPQHQLHQRLLLQVPVLRLLQGQAGREPARQALRPRARRGAAPRGRGLGARRHRSLHAGRHPPRLHRADLSRPLPRGEGSGPRHARPRLLAARGVAGRGDARRLARDVPAPAQGSRPRHASRHRRRRSSTTRSAPFCARTRSTPRSGSR